MVGQVTVIAVLMIVQAALEILMGVFLMVMAFVMTAFVGEVAQQQQAQGGPPFPFELVTGAYVAMAVAGLLPGVFRLIAGIRGLSFRDRTFGIFSLLSGSYRSAPATVPSPASAWRSMVSSFTSTTMSLALLKWRSRGFPRRR